MAWQNTLLPASFRNVSFEIVCTSDDFERSIVTHEYPYIDGANVEDMGRKARRILLTAVFYGDDYEARLQTTLQALEIAGSAELIHPVFGSIQAQFIRANIPHDALQPDYAKITLEFIEAKLRSPLFGKTLPSQQADVINQKADSVLDAAKNRFESDFLAVAKLQALLRERLSIDMLNTIENMQKLVSQITGMRNCSSSTSSYLNKPASFVDELTGGFISRLSAIFTPMNLRAAYAGAEIINRNTNENYSNAAAIGYVRGSIASVWKTPIAHLRQPLLILPDDTISLPNAPLVTTITPDGSTIQPFLRMHLKLQETLAIAGAAAQVFAMDAVNSVLTPADIEIIVTDARYAINESMTKARAIYPDILQSRPLTEPLKSLALAIADVAEKLIRARPPFINRQVDQPANLHLLAHLWYGDYRRADELLRLNPQISNPNFVPNGAILKAYSA